MNEKLLKYFSEELSQDEKISFLQEVKNDENLKKEFARMQNMYALSQMTPLSIDEKKGKKAFYNFIETVKRKKQKHTLRIFLQYAAVAVILITSTFFATQYIYKDSKFETLNSRYVPAGQRAKLT